MGFVQILVAEVGLDWRIGSVHTLVAEVGSVHIIGDRGVICPYFDGGRSGICSHFGGRSGIVKKIYNAIQKH